MFCSYYIQGLLRQANAQDAQDYLQISLIPGGGDVTGPAFAVGGNIAIFDGATGKILQDLSISSSWVPTAAEKGALAGTSGAPSGANPYVTDADPRNTDDRNPLPHQITHQSGSGDALTGLVDANARVVVRKNTGADVGTRRRLNFIEGTNVTLTIADDAGNEEVDITIDATGGGSGLTQAQVLARIC